ncbi:MAG TPA: hypothetical protein VE088_07335 [Gaiellaceae bacterium]|nr:hypothetical protein [Gaiellaceae bacterium]
MKKRLPRKPSPALVISLIALFVALGGTSYAALRLPKNSVGTKQLRNGAVTGKKIRNGAITAGKIKPKGLTVPVATHAVVADTATNAAAVGGIAAAQLQRSITGTCSAGSAIRVVASDGTVTCEAVGSTVLWAVVNADGSIARSSGATGSTHPAAGKYDVTFDRDVSACAYTATIGPASSGSAQGETDVAAQPPDGVAVETLDTTGTNADLPFHLMVVC